ncbi:MAG: CPBP family intramembrane metalloprotease [Cyclobacteriaceae bacterium]|nr:CPBP family intramembrane metalloprotease [Cyclobacteriaceae bacterium]
MLIVIPFFSHESAIGLSLIYSLSLCLALGFGLFIRRQYQFPVKRFSVVPVLIASVSLVGIHLLLDPVTSLVPPSELFNKMLLETVKQPEPYFFMIVIAAPVLEELFFRGIILDGFLKNYNPKYAILASAFLFAVIHGNLPQGIGAFLSGILIGWVYWKTGSVVAGIIIHLINNLVSFVSIMLTPEAELFMSMRDSIGNPLNYWLLVVGSGLIALTGIGVLAKYYFTMADAVETLQEESMHQPKD